MLSPPAKVQPFTLGFVSPCLPTLSRTVPSGPRWTYEIKADGYRFIARRDGDRVSVFSRHGRDWTGKVPAIVEAMHALPVTSATLDGEGVVVDDRGLTDFERLRTAMAGRGRSGSVFLFAFDLLALDGEDLRRHPWEIRRATLTGLLRKASPGIRLSEHLDGDGEIIFRYACGLGAEGIVAKRRDRPYRSGRARIGSKSRTRACRRRRAFGDNCRIIELTRSSPATAPVRMGLALVQNRVVQVILGDHLKKHGRECCYHQPSFACLLSKLTNRHFRKVERDGRVMSPLWRDLR